ncbi:MAG TPA: aminotransferase class I/II-fold pyridoxal phosphate-dependent enzyme [Dongiaceae bacterium]|nr:aminotransferase class I/II-fold pyridoxal phosphate-dependent enzyme [Dongiaceae bacterium]
MGSLTGTSEPVLAYEAALSTFFQAAHSIAVSSGGAALQAAIHAVGVRPGDEVILTPTCPLCTVYPVMAAGAIPVFCDTRKDNFSLSLEDLADVVNPSTRAIIDIPMWGYPTPADELQAFCHERGIMLILDLAHAHGATFKGKHLSAYADVSCFSTHERKLLSTGEGGFIITDNAEIAKSCRDYSRFGNLNGVDFGVNLKLGGLQAALGANRLPNLKQQIARRTETAAAVAQGLRHSALREFDIIDGGHPSYYFMLLRHDFSDSAAFLDYLDSHGVPSDIKRYGCKCLYEFPLIAEYRRECPNAERLLSSVTTVPVHQGIGSTEIGYMLDHLNGYNGR